MQTSEVSLPEDETHRVRTGARTASRPEILRRLAQDPSITVRATVALNPAAPPEVDSLLARDQDERVRALLGRKLAALVPGLAQDAQQELRRHTLAMLTLLIQDEAARVRATVADAVKSMPEAPREIILRLAADPSVM